MALSFGSSVEGAAAIGYKIDDTSRTAAIIAHSSE
jgi:hypothetical protein